MKNCRLIETVQKKLGNTNLSDKKVLIGFDGFVDEVVYVVDERLTTSDYKRLEYLADYGTRILKSEGLSMNIEMIPIQQKLGGNGPIFANSLIAQGCNVTYIGALGKEKIHPVFKEMEKKCHIISLGDPAYTDAIEFLDGKIISSKLANLDTISWGKIVKQIGVTKLAQIIETSDVLGFVNWTMVLHMTDIWGHIIQYVLPNISADLKRKLLFIDLADPEKRKDEDILEALNLLEKFAEYFTVVLGLNKKEACEIAELLGYSIYNVKQMDTIELTKLIKQQLAIDMVVVHSVKEACAADGSGVYYVEGPYCEKPKLTTGAGDHFNAGFILGLMMKCSLEESLLLGTANSGFYVRNAKSANTSELREFLEYWKKDC